MKTLIIIVWVLLLAVNAEAATYWASPIGGATSCAAASGTTDPGQYRTVAQVISCPSAGDTVILKNGAYTTGLSIDGRIHPSGTSVNPITLRAETERQVFFDNRSTPLSPPGTCSATGIVEICFASYWTIEGLRVEHGDHNNANDWRPPVGDWQTTGIVWRRNLIAKANRTRPTGNVHGAVTHTSTKILWEENELYDFEDHGFDCYHLTSSNTEIVYRRNYANGRTYKAGTGQTSGSFTAYPCNGVTWENNISEITGSDPQGGGIHQVPQGNISGNVLRGNISLNEMWGVFFQNRFGDVPSGMVSNSTITDQVVVGAGTGFQSNGAGVTCNHCSFVDGTGDGVLTSNNGMPGGSYSLTMTNTLSYNNKAGYGFTVQQQPTWLLNYTRANSNATNYNHAESVTDATGNIQNSSIADVTNLHGCKVFIPDATASGGASNLLTAGQGGTYIGATVLYATVNGVLQDGSAGPAVKLWNPTTGAWLLKGAAVTGYTTNSIHDIQARLHPTCAEANWPASYRTGITPPSGLIVAGLSTVPAAQPITATVNMDDATATTTDWVGIWPANAPVCTPADAFLSNWQYLNGTQTPPGAPVTAPTVLTFTAPSTNGDYHFCLFSENSLNPSFLLSTSGFTVTSPSIFRSVRLGTGATIKLGPTGKLSIGTLQ